LKVSGVQLDAAASFIVTLHTSQSNDIVA